MWRKLLLISVIASLGTLLALLASSTAPVASAQSQTIPVERLLNPDGTLNLSAGGSGTLDLSGWQVTLDSQRGPILERQSGAAQATTESSTVVGGSDPQGVLLGAPQPAPLWLPLPNRGLSGIVYALAISGSDVYVGGNFTATADGVVKNLGNIAKFNTNLNTWLALPNNGLNSAVYALGISGSDLYVGGDFTQSADAAVINLNGIARFSGGAWSALPHKGLNGAVYAFAFTGSDLYVGGGFTQTADYALGTAVTNLFYIAKFSGGAWSALPHNGLSSYVNALAVSGSDLYVGGTFTQTFDGALTNLNNIARFSGGAWSALPHNGLDNAVYALAVRGSDLYVGGLFIQTADGAVTNLNRIAKFSGGAWSALPNNGLNSIVNALAISGSDLYVGGVFIRTADGVVGNLGAIAHFSTISNTWSAPPNKGLFGGGVYALAVKGNDVYVGGNFSQTVDGVRTNLGNIANLTNDTDGDGIPDDWERNNGVTINGVKIDLPAMGANPLHKDLFVHADWMNSAGLKPDARDIQIVSDAFENAPLPNPDGTTGVHLHVDLGPESVMDPVKDQKTWGTLSKAGVLPYQALIGSTAGKVYNWTDTDNIKQIHFNPAQRGAVFHYMCFCSSLGGQETTSGISRGILAHDFLVTLGGVEGGTSLEKAGTFMHELGHNLGLRHGGGDGVNFKPNFLSVMNYSFQFIGLLTPSGGHIERSFDYSRRQLPTLAETALVESAGIGDLDGHLTFWNIDQPNDSCQAQPNDYFSRLAYPATDWFCDGALTPDPVQADINGDGVCVGPGRNLVLDTFVSGDDVVIGGGFITAGPNRKCESFASGDDVKMQEVGFEQPNQLTGFDDWPAVRFDGGGQIGQLPNVPAERRSLAPSDAITRTEDEPTDEPTYEQIRDSVPPVLFDAETTAPIDVVSYSPANGSAPLAVAFDGGASTTPTGTVTSWVWNFGDGAVGSGPTITHSYSVPGTYFATLIVTNNNGHVNLVSLRHRVTVGNSSPPPTPTPTPTWEGVVLTAGQAEIKTWTIGGRTSAYLKVSFPNAGYRVVDWGQPVRTGTDFAADASVEKFTGGSVQAVTTTAQIYDLGPLADGNYTFTFKNSGTVVKSQAFTVSSAVPPPNSIDDAGEFVKQQYRDFLNREADPAGLAFWTDNITLCSNPARRPAGQTEAQCTLRQRETTSGAFFQSPEFQYTGYYVLRMYQGALGRQPKLSEFTPDAQFVGAGILVNSQLSAAKINQNKADFAAQFVNCTDATKSRCAEFKAIYDGLNNQEYVDALFVKTGANPSTSERAALVNGLNAGPATETRATVLQKVVDGIVVISEGNQTFTTTYGQAFYNSESNRAFVLLEYFGYMKRDPDDAGYAFWLGKLNQFNGNFVNAEMVLAFISSPEYRARFGQP